MTKMMKKSDSLECENDKNAQFGIFGGKKTQIILQILFDKYSNFRINKDSFPKF